MTSSNRRPSREALSQTVRALFAKPEFWTAVIVAVIGLNGQLFLSKREEEQTKRSQQELDGRLYTELMTRREESASGLRKDMFATILKEFMKEGEADADTDISKQLLRLELLALNFGESLSLSPLFHELNRNLTAIQGPMHKVEYAMYADRLRSLARQVAGNQVSALQTGGIARSIQIPLDAVIAGTYTWPNDEIRGQLTEYRSVLGGSAATDSLMNEMIEEQSDISLDGVISHFSVQVRHADEEAKTVDVRLRAYSKSEEGEKETQKEKDTPSTAAVEIERSFELDFFDFPMIDNTRLINDQRVALIMNRFDRDQRVIDLALVVFPGLYSGQRDQPFLDVVIHQLKNVSDQAENQ